MNSKRTTRRRLLLSAVSLVLLLLPLTTVVTMAAPPNPILVYTGKENYVANGQNWTRYKLSVSNWAVYPAAMFAAAPNLPPCGQNANSSRTWVDIYDVHGNRIYGFCSFNDPKDLTTMWFAVEQGKPPTPRAWIVMTDRKTGKKYKSNPVSIS